MRYVTCSVLALWIPFLCGQAMAYPTSIATRDFDHKLATDDLVVVTLKSVGGEIWFMAGDHSGFQVGMEPVHQSLELQLRLPALPGFNVFALVPSYDDVIIPKAGTSDMKMYFNTDFTWIEVSPSGGPAFPVRSTVFFLGPSQYTYDYYMTTSFPYVRYAKYQDLKKDIQENYANIYNPDAVGLINYRPQGKAAIVNAIGLFE